ncbi:hypothetical protein K435DRAFT_772660 [Dendrothele bispora CBS 962.96]|uniref:GAE domain-containing protein n=1 Tax=Dendrothele bispora (strain CBS 962.96) TaxID=1314807 RepID=A0A4S8MVI4_DENBC|nr:hypothetical protein K435DRAFT_772660 [Dendrothele bispora CBS 962.96]
MSCNEHPARANLNTMYGTRTTEGPLDAESHHVSPSPSWTLPVELLIEIFSLYSPSLSITDSKVLPTTLALSQTCSSWRQLAISLPNLWSNLSLDLTHENANIPALVNLYLARSEPQPLILRVDGVTTSVHGEAELATELSPSGWSVLTSLLNAHDRWSNVSFYLHWELLDIDYNSLTTMVPSFPLLQSFAVSWQNDREIRVSNRLFRVLHDLPALRSLQIDSYLPYFPFNLSNLSRINVTKCRLCAEVRFLLARCKNLSEAEFTMDGHPDDDDLIPVNVFPVNKLQSLKLTFSGMRVGCNLLSSLTLPSLTKLDLSSRYTDIDQHITLDRAFKDFSLRSRCQLTKLRLTGQFGTDFNLIQILSMAPTITHLALDVRSSYSDYVTDDLFEMLSLGPIIPESSATSTDILPRLTDFSLVIQQSQNSTYFTFIPTSYSHKLVLPPLPDPDVILSMVESRFHPSSTNNRAKLQRFALSVRINLDRTEFTNDWGQLFRSATEPPLRALEREGLHLDLNIKEGPEAATSPPALV